MSVQLEKQPDAQLTQEQVNNTQLSPIPQQATGYDVTISGVSMTSTIEALPDTESPQAAPDLEIIPDTNTTPQDTPEHTDNPITPFAAPLSQTKATLTKKNHPNRVRNTTIGATAAMLVAGGIAVLTNQDTSPSEEAKPVAPVLGATAPAPSTQAIQEGQTSVVISTPSEVIPVVPPVVVETTPTTVNEPAAHTYANNPNYVYKEDLTERMNDILAWQPSPINSGDVDGSPENFNEQATADDFVAYLTLLGDISNNMGDFVLDANQKNPEEYLPYLYSDQYIEKNQDTLQEIAIPQIHFYSSTNYFPDLTANSKHDIRYDGTNVNVMLLGIDDTGEQLYQVTYDVETTYLPGGATEENERMINESLSFTQRSGVVKYVNRIYADGSSSRTMVEA